MKMRHTVSLATSNGNLDEITSLFPVDLVPIKFHNLSFSYRIDGGEVMTKVLTNTSVEISQGVVACI